MNALAGKYLNPGKRKKQAIPLITGDTGMMENQSMRQTTSRLPIVTSMPYQGRSDEVSTLGTRLVDRYECTYHGSRTSPDAFVVLAAILSGRSGLNERHLEFSERIQSADSMISVSCGRNSNLVTYNRCR
jgi:hypothetical protein